MENTEISQNKLIEALYYKLYSEDLHKNVIETEELNKAYWEYCNKYIEPLHAMSYDAGNEASNKFDDVVFGYCRRSFEVGFKAAISLLSLKQAD